MRFRTIGLICIFSAAITFTSVHAQQTSVREPVMRGALLGTGFPMPDPERAGPSNAVFVGDKVFLVDTGGGVTMRLAALRPPRPPHVEAVFITHLHSDHTGGLPDVFNSTWVMGRSKPLELYGPQGIAEVATAMKAFFAEDIHIRRDLTEMKPAAGAEIQAHVVQPGVIYDDGEVKVIAFAVDHAPVKPAFGYRFESHGRVIVFSGDYHPHDDLVTVVKGADVLVSEAYAFGPNNPDGKSNPIARYHCTPEQAAELAKAAGVKKLILTHLVPPSRADEMVERARKIFSGEIIAGKDLLTF